jgi:hypothetical protein
MLVGLLASTGLRSGETLRLDRADVDLVKGVLQMRRTKFRKDRLVPLHFTTRDALRTYAQARDASFPEPKSPAFFLSLRGNRLSKAALLQAFHGACAIADLNQSSHWRLRPHDRHRFATPAALTKIAPARDSATAPSGTVTSVESSELREELPGLCRNPAGCTPRRRCVVTDEDACPYRIAGVAAREVDAGGGHSTGVRGSGQALGRAAIHVREIVELRHAVLWVCTYAVATCQCKNHPRAW